MTIFDVKPNSMNSLSLGFNFNLLKDIRLWTSSVRSEHRTCSFEINEKKNSEVLSVRMIILS